jgi:predicted nucleic acid-binding protein
LKVEYLVKEDFAKAMEIMNDFGLDFEDSLHLAVVLRKNVKEIVSNYI